MFDLGRDETIYREIETQVPIAQITLDGQSVLRIPRQVLSDLAAEAIRDVMHLLRPSHLEQLRSILDDPDATNADKYVAFSFLKNANIAAGMVLPGCQDTGTAAVYGWKGQYVWTDGGDGDALSQGIETAYKRSAFRYSQVSPLDMYNEANTGDNLPAQIDIQAVDGGEYNLMFVAKGGGSANKSGLFQASPSILTPEALFPFIEEKIRGIGTHACPPYHLAVVVGGTSAEANLKTVKLASCHYLDGLPTEGGTQGKAFRDLEMEQKILEATQNFGIGAQFGGKYFCHDVRVIRLPRHGASLPIGIGVSCNADRQIKAKINANGVFLEQLERDPARYLPDIDYAAADSEVIEVDIDRPMADILDELKQYPTATRLSLTGTLTVARDTAHRHLLQLVNKGAKMPSYMIDHPIFYSGPAKTPDGYASGAFGPTTAARMDPFLDDFMSHGASMITLSKGNRTSQASKACGKYGGFYLSTIGGAGALFGSETIKQVDVLDFEDFGMEAVWRLKVENFPAFIAIDYQGNDFYEQFMR